MYLFFRNFSLISLLFLCTTLLLQAQSNARDLIQTGPRLAVAMLSKPIPLEFNIGDFPIHRMSLTPRNQVYGYSAGMFTQINILDYLFLRTEAFVHLSKRSYQLDKWSTAETDNITFRLYDFSLPLRIAYSVEKVNLQIGWIWKTQLRRDWISPRKSNFDYRYDESYSYLSFGLGYQYGKILLDLHYNIGLGNAENVLLYDGIEFMHNYQQRTVLLTVGFVLSGND